MTPPNWADLAAAYALDALDPDERRAFEAQMAADPALRDEVDSYREVMGLLADAVPARPAPDTLRERVMAEASAVRPIASARAEPETGGPREAAATAPTATRAPERRSKLPWFLAAAAMIAALSLGLANRQLMQSRANLEAALDQASEQVTAQADEIASRDSLLAAFLGPDVRSTTLVSTEELPAARIFHNLASNSVVIAAFDLPPAPVGRIYQLWGIPDGGDPVSLGTFQTAANGTALLRTTAPAGSNFAVGAITEEPEGGSQQPTSTPFLVGEWAQQ